MIDVDSQAPTEQADAPAKTGGVLVAVPRWFMVVMIAGIFLPWVLVLTSGSDTSSRIMGTGSTSAAPDSELSRVSNPGPWGRLQYSRITIAPPLEFIAELQPIADRGWHFVGMSRADLAVFFTNVSDLQPADRQWLVENAAPDTAAMGLVINPPDDLVRRLTPKARALIYHRLHEWEINVAQNAAFRFGGGSVDEWIANAPLSASTIEQVKALAYQNGTYQFFADLHLVLPTIKDDRERTALTQTMARESTLLLKLLVEDNDDVDKLVGYWGRGGRSKDVRPLLDSLARIPGVHRIDVVHLLPRFARSRLYTYPGPSSEPAFNNQDCHWTALNFFQEPPRQIDADKIAQTIKDEFYPIYGNLAFGDLVLYLTKSGDLFHSAIYIADDILYTKNGARSSRPWMFARMDDMQYFYPQKDGFEVRYFRRKGF